jgi:hypothetical protein
VNCVRAKRLVLIADEIVVNHKHDLQRSTPERLKFGQDLLALLEATMVAHARPKDLWCSGYALLWRTQDCFERSHHRHILIFHTVLCQLIGIGHEALYIEYRIPALAVLIAAYPDCDVFRIFDFVGYELPASDLRHKISVVYQDNAELRSCVPNNAPV